MPTGAGGGLGAGQRLMGGGACWALGSCPADLTVCFSTGPCRGIPAGPPILPSMPQLPFTHARAPRVAGQGRERPPWMPRVSRAPEGDVACIQACRLDRGSVEELCQLLGPQLQPRVASRWSIPAVQKILMGLHCLATGTVQAEFASWQDSANRCVDLFLEAMLPHQREYIVFPTEEAQLWAVREAFCAVAGFPNVIGAVGTTLTPVGSSGWHCCHSLKVQATCDAQGLFPSVSAVFPSFAPDAQVFDGSGLQPKVASWPQGRGWLLGKEGPGGGLGVPGLGALLMGLLRLQVTAAIPCARTCSPRTPRTCRGTWPATTWPIGGPGWPSTGPWGS